MGLAEKPLQESWDHDAGADRVEHIAAYNPDLRDRIWRIALRFISENGLSEEFADVLGKIERVEASRLRRPRRRDAGAVRPGRA